jgi:hypothetical protein
MNTGGFAPRRSGTRFPRRFVADFLFDRPRYTG